MNLFLVSFLSLCLGIEVFFVCAVVSAFVPQQLSPVISELFDVYRQNVIPERDVLLYRIFIAAVAAVFILLFGFRKLLKARVLKQASLVQGLLTAAQIFCAFKLLIYRQSIFIKLYFVFLGISILTKIFWPEVRRFIDAMDVRLKDDRWCARAAVWVQRLFPLLVLAIVWVPDYRAAVARMFMGEQFHHLDYFLVPAGWSHISGNVLGVDNISRYGLGGPVIVSEIAQRFLGGFNYETAVLVMMGVAVIYYLLWFQTLRWFFGTVGLAIVVALAGIRLQLFHQETFPFIFTYPQLTPLRFFFDAVVFGLLARHIRRPSFTSLLLSAVSCGLAVYNVTGEGLYLLAAFYVFVLAREMYAIKTKEPGFSALGIRQRTVLLVLPWLVTFACVWLTIGRHAFGKEFWNNQLEFIRFYSAGHQSAPIMNNLVPGFVLEAGMAFVIPALYALMLVWLLGLMIEKKVGRRGLVVLAALAYALADYHYHAQVSNNTTAYLRIGPVLAFLGGFWFWRLIGNWDNYRRRLAVLSALGLIIISMVTNHMFLLYPNIFNLSRNPMTHPVVSQNPPGRFSYFNHLFISYPDAFKLSANSLGERDEKLYIEKDFAGDKQLKEFYKQEMDYSKDAALIDRLVPANEAVPLISSFEVSILMQAKRRPFFYTVQLINSRPRRMRNFVVTLIYTASNFKREVDRIESRKPQYIFMEKIFLTPEVPQAYLHDSQDLVALLNYVFAHYKPAEAGEYLMALKRKD